MNKLHRIGVFTHDWSVHTGLECSHRIGVFTQDWSVLTGLECSHRIRVFTQDWSVDVYQSGSRCLKPQNSCTNAQWA